MEDQLTGAEAQDVAAPAAEDTNSVETQQTGGNEQGVANPAADGATGSDDTGGDGSQTRDFEKDAAYAALRREKEEALKRIKEADDMIAAQYGSSHGIYTMDQYKAALAKQRQEEEAQRWQERGIDPEELNGLIDQHPAVQEAKALQRERNLVTNFEQLSKEFPDLVKTPNDVSDEVFQKWNEGKSGLSLVDAYTLVNRKTIMDRSVAAAKQSALNNINGKNHIRGNAGDGGGNIETTSIPPETLSMYRRFFPDMTETQFIAHYKKSQEQGG